MKYTAPYLLKTAYKGDVGYDIKALEFIKLEPGEVKRIPTGVKLELPPTIWAEVRPKSGISSKGIMVHPGTIDTGYRGIIDVIMQNLTNETYIIERLQSVAQVVFHQVVEEELIKQDRVEEGSERGEKGFGSSGLL